MMEQGEGECIDTMETPKEKKRVLKRIKKRKLDLNISTRRKKSFSFGRSNVSMNSSIHKQSLHANNKALAFNLEKAREAVRQANEVHLDLQRQNQELHMRVTTLERVAGLKEKDVEGEVQLRLKKQMTELKSKMVGMTRKFYDAFACMDEVMNACNLLPRYSSGSNRGLFVGSSSDSSICQAPTENHRRSLFSELPKDTNCDGISLEPRRELIGPTGPCNMSMIAETSVLLEDITPLNALMYDIDETQNDIVQPSSKPENKCDTAGSWIVKRGPQRVLRRSGGSPKGNNSEQLRGSTSLLHVPTLTRAGSPAVANKRTDRRGTFVINVKDKLPSPDEHSQKSVSKSPSQDSTETPSEAELVMSAKSPIVTLQTKKNKLKSTEGVKNSPNVTSRSKSRGKLNLPSVVVTDSVNTVESSDRRKTFVLPIAGQTTEPKFPTLSKSAECLSTHDDEGSADDRRRTFLVPPPLPKPSVSNKTLSPCLPTCEDNVTQCFSVDMEMTEVIDSTQLIEIGTSKLDQSKENMETAIGNEKMDSLKQIGDISMLFPDNISLLPISSDSSDSEATRPAPVEFRVPRPGKIVFSASRKQLDGTRKPVPSKLPLRARSKSKIKLSRSKGQKAVPESPKELKSIFDFHDRTPKSVVGSSVYDLSMNESLQDNRSKPTLNDFRSLGQEKQKQNGKTSKSKEDGIKILPDNPVYFVPLKECSPEARSRSQSNSRSRQENKDKENEGRNVRARSRSRKRDEENSEKTDKDCNAGPSRERSRSKRRQPESSDTEPDDESKDEGRKSRGRSRSRRRNNDKEISGEKGEDEIVKSRASSRSKQRPNYAEVSDLEEELEKPYACRRSRSELGGKVHEDETSLCMDKEVKEMQSGRSRTRSRSRRRVDTGEDKIQQNEMNARRSRSKRRKETADDEETEDTEVQLHQSKERPQGKQSEDRAESKVEKEVEIRQSRARSHGRQNHDSAESEVEKEVEIRQSRARSRDRQTRDSAESEVEKEVEICQLRAQSPGRQNRDGAETKVEKEVEICQSRAPSRGRQNRGSAESEVEKEVEICQSRAWSHARQNRDSAESAVEKEVEICQSRARSPDKQNRDSAESEVEKEVDIRRSRARSRSRQNRDSTESEVEKEVEIRRSRARSRGRQNRDSTESEVEKEVEICQSRTRSQDRQNPDSAESEVEKEAKSCKSRARSRSRRRIDSDKSHHILPADTESQFSVSKPVNFENKLELKSEVGRQDDVKNGGVGKPQKEQKHAHKKGEDLTQERRESKRENDQARARSKAKSSRAQTHMVQDSDDETGKSKIKSACHTDVTVIACSDEDDYEVVIKGGNSDRGKERKSTKKSHKSQKSDEEDILQIKENGNKCAGLTSPPEMKSLSRSKRVLKTKHKASSIEQLPKTNTNEESRVDKGNEYKEQKDESYEIPRLSDILFVTRRDRSLKPAKRRHDAKEQDNDDLLFDFENMPASLQQIVPESTETSIAKTPKGSRTPALQGSKTPKGSRTPALQGSKTPKGSRTPATQRKMSPNASGTPAAQRPKSVKDKDPKLKTLKSTKSSMKKRRRSSTSSVSDQTTPCINVDSMDKENDRPAGGASEQLQNLRQRLAVLQGRKFTSSIGSRPSGDLSFDFTKLDMGENEPESKRQRRGASKVVSYKEISGNKKLRREDVEGKSNLFQTAQSASSTPVASRVSTTE